MAGCGWHGVVLARGCWGGRGREREAALDDGMGTENLSVAGGW